MTRDEAMKVWREADRAGEDAYVDAIQAGAVTADDAHKAGSLAAATVIQQAFAERDGEIERLREALRDMADAVAVYSQQPVEATRQRPRIHQDQWEQITMICGDMLRQALTAKGDSRG